MEKVKEYLEKAKDRVIHEFEYQNGKYIQHYVLGGEHELTPQEIVDCLNALATMDCDLQTAYAYIKGQDEKNRELKEQLAIREKALELACLDLIIISQTSQMKEINVTEEELDNTQKHFIEQAKESIDGKQDN